MARRTGYRRPKEVVLAEGMIVKEVPATTLDKNVIKMGTEVKIARVIKTPIGLRYRIFNTTRWIPEDNIDCSHDAEIVVDYTKHLENHENSKFMQLFGDDLKKKELKTKKKLGNTCSVPKIERKKRSVNKLRIKNTMDKQDIKKAIAGLGVGEQVTLTFLSTFPPECLKNEKRYEDVLPLVGQTKTYTYLQTKKGRGKGGSQLMVLETDAGTKISVGTPHSETLLNIRTDSGLFGPAPKKKSRKFTKQTQGKLQTYQLHSKTYLAGKVF